MLRFFKILTVRLIGTANISLPLTVPHAAETTVVGRMRYGDTSRSDEPSYTSRVWRTPSATSHSAMPLRARPRRWSQAERLGAFQMARDHAGELWPSAL